MFDRKKERADERRSAVDGCELMSELTVLSGRPTATRFLRHLLFSHHTNTLAVIPHLTRLATDLHNETCIWTPSQRPYYLTRPAPTPTAPSFSARKGPISAELH